MDAWRIAFATADEDTQLAIVASGVPQLRAALARSSTLGAKAAEALLALGGSTHDAAVRALTDPEQLAHHAGRKGPKSVWAARNRNTPSGSLEALLKRRGHLARFWALCNQSLDEDVRKGALDEAAVAEFCMTGGSNTEFIGRAMELVRNNWWLAHNPSRWPSQVRRAIALDPRADKDVIRRVRAGGSHRWPMLAYQPLAQENPPKWGPTPSVHGWNLEALVHHGGTTAALEGLTRSECDFAAAWKLLGGCGLELDPHTHALGIARFGPWVADTLTMSQTRVGAITTLEPMMGWVKTQIRGEGQPLEAAQAERDANVEAAKLLGSEAQAWRIFAALAESGHRDVVEMAQAATAV